MQPVPIITNADVERLVRREFPAGQVEQVLAVLREYGVEGWHRETDRVRAAILKLADGKLEELRRHLDCAKSDYRDVLAYAEYPNYFKETTFVAGMREEEVEKIVAEDWRAYQEWLSKG